MSVGNASLRWRTVAWNPTDTAAQQASDCRINELLHWPPNYRSTTDILLVSYGTYRYGLWVLASMYVQRARPPARLVHGHPTYLNFTASRRVC